MAMKQRRGKTEFAKLISILKNVLFFLSLYLFLVENYLLLMSTIGLILRIKLLVSTHYMLNALKFCNIIVKGTIKLSFLVLLPMATSSLRALPLYYSRNLNYIYTLVVEIFFYTVCR